MYSLRRVLDEIEQERGLITREVFVCNFGHRFDASSTDIFSRHLHDAFDELARTSASSRTRGDTIHPDVFHELRGRLKSSDAIRSYSHKVLAHAAAPSNRPRDLAVTLTGLRNAYKDLVFVARMVSARILWDVSSDFLPVYTCNPLQHLDSPICPASHFDELGTAWREQYRDLQDLDRNS